MGSNIFTVVLFVSFLAAAQAQPTWCGKHYMKGSPVVPPGGQFQFPATSKQPLLNFQCWPAVKPYISGETPSLIMDARVTSLNVPGAAPLQNTKNLPSLDVTVSVNGKQHALGSVKLNSTGTEFSLPRNFLEPQKQPHTVTCTARIPGTEETFTTSTEIFYLSPPSQGSVTKQDFRTGSLLVKDKNGEWKPILPVGFYTSFDGFLTNVSNVDDIKSRGLNIIHPVPTFDNETAFVQVLDRMEELGLWLMYDMRFTYQNLTSVAQQVKSVQNRTNLLLWYTGDEPDGTSDPLNATKVTYDYINELDGYHPISLVLNCQDYFFEEYSLGADVLMQDTYPIDINATFSRVWDAPCTPDFGDCGCDNCKGSLEDISTRMDEFKQRLDLLGRGRSTTLWTVPQAFGKDTYWPRFPTGDEWLVESILGINHRGFGVVSWDDPTSPDIRTTSSALAAAAPDIISFLAAPEAKFTAFKQGRVDIGTWSLEKQTLLLAANPDTVNSSAVVTGVQGQTVKQILNGGSTLTLNHDGVILSLEGTGTGGWILSK